MPRIFARIGTNDKIVEIINETGTDTWDDEWPLAFRNLCQDITEEDPMPEIGWTFDDPGFSPPGAPVLTRGQEFKAALAAGLEIESTGTPTLDATYHAQGARYQLMLQISSYIDRHSAFPSGLVELEWKTLAGGPVTFAATADFQAVTRAVVDWITDWYQYVDEVSGATEPPAGVTIA